MIYLETIGLLLGMMLMFVIVEKIAHRFAHKHPEFGAPRKLGCGGCGGGHCEKGSCDSSEH